MKNSIYVISLCILLSNCEQLFAQNVGIGNLTPSEKLDVAGNVKADTLKSNALRILPNAGTGKVLTSDAMGNGNWEALSLDSGEDNGNLGYGVWGDCQTNNNITAFQPMADTAGAIYDHFGKSVAISGDYAIVGSPQDDDTFNNQGSASIYHFNGTEWTLMQKLIDPNAAAGDRLGEKVALSGGFAFASSITDDEPITDQGSVCIFQFDGTSWVFTEKIVDPGGEASDYFGQSISASGNFLIVGVPSDNEPSNDQGSACIFQYDGSNWVFMTKLLDDVFTATDNFGFAVSIFENRCVIGIPRDYADGQNEGSVMIFQFDGTTWIFEQKIYDPYGLDLDYFGHSVDLEGNRIVVGSPFDDDQFSNQGSVCFFRYNGVSWVFEQKYLIPTPVSGDYFGSNVALSGDFALIGSYNRTRGAQTYIGSAFLFQRLGLSWTQYQEFFDPAPTYLGYFGWGCDLDITTRRFIVSNYGYNNEMGKVSFGRIQD